MSSENNNQSVQDLLNIDLDAIVEEGQQKAAKKRKKTAVTTAIVAAICLVIAVVYVVINVVIPMGQYKDATKLLEQKEFQEAINGFEALSDFKDSADMVLETKYQWAESLLAEKAYDEAYKKFKEIKDYSDAGDRMKDVRYTEADDYLKSCAYLKAIELFERLDGYKDSRTRVLEASYLWAEDYLKQGQLEDALLYFERAGLYKDAKARADEVYEMMQIHATAVKLNKTSLTINKGKTAELTVTLEPADTTDTIVSWTSSDEKVATVDKNGVVTAVGYGKATIEVKTSNELIAGCTITVPEPSTTANAPTKVPTSTTPDTGVVYGTSKNLPDSAIPLTTDALEGLFRSVPVSGNDVGLYWISFENGKFTRRRQYSSLYDAYESDAPFYFESYQDTGYYSLDGVNLTVTYRRWSEENPSQITDWKTETWPIAYVHPYGIRFDCIVSQAKSYYRIS